MKTLTRTAWFWTAFCVTAFVVYVPAVSWAYIDAYYLHPGHWKFGSRGWFELQAYVLGWLTFCTVTQFAITSRLYFRARLPLTRRWAIAHGVYGGVISYFFFSSGVSMRVLDLLGERWFSSNGVPEIILAVLIVGLLPYIFLISVERACLVFPNIKSHLVPIDREAVH